jgi:hypothetical protein
MVDPSVAGQYTDRAVCQVAAVAAMCVQPEAEFRPLMVDVVKTLEQLVAGRAHDLVQIFRTGNALPAFPYLLLMHLHVKNLYDLQTKINEESERGSSQAKCSTKSVKFHLGPGFLSFDDASNVHLPHSEHNTVQRHTCRTGDWSCNW